MPRWRVCFAVAARLSLLIPDINTTHFESSSYAVVASSPVMVPISAPPQGATIASTPRHTPLSHRRRPPAFNNTSRTSSITFLTLLTASSSFSSARGALPAQTSSGILLGTVFASNYYPLLPLKPSDTVARSTTTPPLERELSTKQRAAKLSRHCPAQPRLPAFLSQAERQSDRQAGRQEGRQAGREADSFAFFGRVHQLVCRATMVMV